MSSIIKQRPTITLATRFIGVRYTAKTKLKKIPVQLLKNIEGLGVRGEIVQVKPTHMMNWLQFQNRACFILPGQPPRIPVVDLSGDRAKALDLKRQEALIARESNAQRVEELSKVKLEDLSKLTGLNFGN